MLKKLLYLSITLCLTANFSLSQKNAEPSMPPSSRQKAADAVSGNQIVEMYLLIEGKVKTVDNGDTIGVETISGIIYPVWLQGIDAPEEGQDFWVEAQKNLKDLVIGKNVTVVVRKRSPEHFIGTVYAEGKDVNLKQIESGMAWHFKQNGYEQTEENQKLYGEAEQKARTKGKGLWKDKNPVSPSEYRAEQRSIKVEKKTPAEKPVETIPANSGTNAADTPTVESKKSAGRTYIRGARGGCYYINSNGNKTYVDRSLCN